LASGCFHRIKTGTVERVGGDGGAKGAFAPRRSRSTRHERGGQAGEEFGLGTGGGEGQTDAARHFDYASGDLEQLEAQCRELGLGQVALFRNGVADGEHEPVGGGVQNEADLVGERRAARRAIGGKLSLVQLDEIFRLPARAVESFIEPFGRAAVEIGDDEADVEAEPRGLDAGDGAPLLVPGAGPVARLGVADADEVEAEVTTAGEGQFDAAQSMNVPIRPPSMT
jgi:hypothetical protein